MDVAAVRTALKSTLALSGVNSYGYVSANPQPPCAVVGWPDEIDPRVVLGSGTDYRIDVFLFVGWSDGQVADDALMTLVDETVAALDADPTLGGAVMSATATSVTDFSRTGTDDGRALLGCRMTVEVYT